MINWNVSIFNGKCKENDTKYGINANVRVILFNSTIENKIQMFINTTDN